MHRHTVCRLREWWRGGSYPLDRLVSTIVLGVQTDLTCPNLGALIGTTLNRQYLAEVHGHIDEVWLQPRMESRSAALYMVRPSRGDPRQAPASPAAAGGHQARLHGPPQPDIQLARWAGKSVNSALIHQGHEASTLSMALEGSPSQHPGSAPPHVTREHPPVQTVSLMLSEQGTAPRLQQQFSRTLGT
jgi:hypothetical protein